MNANRMLTLFHAGRTCQSLSVDFWMFLCIVFFALFGVFRGEPKHPGVKKEWQAKGEKSLPPEKEGELESFIISAVPVGFLTLRDQYFYQNT